MIDRKERLRREYVSRINRVIDYISGNLDGDLSLARLAREASFSPFHFHRIFHAMVGETLNGFIRRVRIEHAAGLLVACPARPITGIALDCGFSGSAAFARAFKERFGKSASEFRKSKIRKTESKRGKDFGSASLYIDGTRPERQRKISMEVEVKQMPEMHVAYVRNIGLYNTIGKAFERLMQWAGPRNLLQFPKTKSLGVYHDDPKVTDPDKLRADACITVPEDTEVDGDIGKTTIPGGLFAVAHVEITKDQFTESWDKLMGEWLPESGYQPDDRMCYELYLNDPKDHPEGKFIVDICEPVRPL